MELGAKKSRSIILLLIRVWLGYRMITASYSSVTGVLFDPKERLFFIKWFGEQLHYPWPLTMALLAKTSEFEKRLTPRPLFCGNDKR